MKRALAGFLPVLWLTSILPGSAPPDSAAAETPALAAGKGSAHWAFQPIRRPTVPRVRNKAVVRNPIDAFVVARLEKEGIAPSPEADRVTLIRRLSLDLLGLPPSIDEIDTFLADERPDAYERLVDRLLDSSHYGERWGRHWLDVARYADSRGYTRDTPRQIWRYRDWVINAFNQDVPFDRFTIEQFAGDLLPGGTLEQVVATGFHRNALKNDEGGKYREESRVETVVDQVNTTGTAYLGLTIGCARCHDHKFDPITQREFYQLFAFFNSTEEPEISAPTPMQAARRETLRKKVSEAQEQLRQEMEQIADRQDAWERAVAARPPVAWTVLAPSGGAKTGLLPDGSIRRLGTTPAAETYTVVVDTDLNGVTAFRLEVFSDPYVGEGDENDNIAAPVVLRVTDSLQAWANGAANLGWALVPLAGGGNSLDFHSSEAAVSEDRPQLTVDFVSGSRFRSTPFQQGVDGYNDTVDLTVGQASPDEPRSDGKLRVDDDDPGGTGSDSQILLRFANIFGAGPGQIPLGSAIVSARLRLSVRGTGSGFRMHRMLRPWDASATWSRLDGGVQADGEESTVASDGRAIGGGDADANGRKYDFPSLRVSMAPPERPEDDVPVVLSPVPGDRAPARARNAAARGDAQANAAFRASSGRGHRVAVFQTQEDVDAARGTKLRFTLSPRTGEPIRTDRVRLSATTAQRPVRADGLPDRARRILATAPNRRTWKQRAELAARFRKIDPRLSQRQSALAELEERYTQLNRFSAKTQVMREMEAPRITAIHIRGDFLDPGERVTPAVPGVLPPLPGGLENPNRLDLARWLVDPQNPLTARVTINRIWQRYFGRGIVETENDFGTRGSRPTHPRLLDWLAREFIDQGWSIKAMHRLIVGSSTYRQSSRVRPDLAEVDPKNTLLARQSRLRLEGEVIRDAVLAASGLLSREIGGPGVYPPQPDGVMELSRARRRWTDSRGEDRYRRGMYTQFYRSTPFPFLKLFDAPDSFTSCTRRDRSNTPLQALALLNDQVCFESAKALAVRVLTEVRTADPYERIRHAFRLCLAREPTDEEVTCLSDLLTAERNDPDQGGADAKLPVTLPPQTHRRDLDAWISASRALLNLDEFITRE